MPSCSTKIKLGNSFQNPYKIQFVNVKEKNEEIMGSFIQATKHAPLPVPASPIKKKAEKKKIENARHKDIRDFFSRETRQERTKKKNSHGHNIITID